MLVLLVPLLLLAAACIVVFGPAGSEHARAKIAAYPVGAAFLGGLIISIFSALAELILPLSGDRSR